MFFCSLVDVFLEDVGTLFLLFRFTCIQGGVSMNDFLVRFVVCGFMLSAGLSLTLVSSTCVTPLTCVSLPKTICFPSSLTREAPILQNCC